MEEDKPLKITRFIRRLFKIVNDPNFPEIGWSKSGLQFIILDKNTFMQNSLKYLSKTTEYSTFIRLLYVYGFSKSKHVGSSDEEYYHPSFRKNGEDVLCYIKRVVDNKNFMLQKKSIKTSNELQEFLHFLNSQNLKLESEVKVLRERVEQQECTINGLIQIFSRLFRANEKTNESICALNNKYENKDLMKSIEDVNDTHNSHLKGQNDTHNSHLKGQNDTQNRKENSNDKNLLLLKKQLKDTNYNYFSNNDDHVKKHTLFDSEEEDLLYKPVYF